MLKKVITCSWRSRSLSQIQYHNQQQEHRDQVEFVSIGVRCRLKSSIPITVRKKHSKKDAYFLVGTIGRMSG